MRTVLLLILPCCLAFTPVLSQEEEIEKIARVVDLEMPALVPLRDTVGFDDAILRMNWADTDRQVRRLVKDNGRSRKTSTVLGTRWVTGLRCIPVYLMQQPGVLLCLLIHGRSEELQLVVEYAEGTGRKNRVYSLKFTGTIPEATMVPYPGTKGRWKVVAVK